MALLTVERTSTSHEADLPLPSMAWAVITALPFLWMRTSTAVPIVTPDLSREAEAEEACTVATLSSLLDHCRRLSVASAGYTVALRLKRLRSPLTVTRGRFISSELTMTSGGLGLTGVPFCVMVSVVVMEGALVDDKTIR